ncbi:hypothetical protein TWF481_006493 [Arthrobotrys musiformis]|uniref:Uncharacterized protein n=1 Tax=Arthrobotrys musiformis TaxID=47236 RepID=A0AAV9W8S8_9PEZI
MTDLSSVLTCKQCKVTSKRRSACQETPRKEFNSKGAGRYVPCMKDTIERIQKSGCFIWSEKKLLKKHLKTAVKLQTNFFMPFRDWTFHTVLNVGPLRDSRVSNSPSLNGPRTKRNVGRDLESLTFSSRAKIYTYCASRGTGSRT